MEANKIKKDYFLGQFEPVLSCKNSVKTVGYKIGSMVFLGRHKEARLLDNEYGDKLSLDDQILSRFHLGLSYTRTSEYKLAKQIFEQNLKLEKNKKLTAISRFYIYHGLAFFEFFFSQHQSSQDYAEKAYAQLLKLKTRLPLLEVLSLDLQAHNLLRLGYIQQGLEQSKKSLRISRQYKLKNFEAAIQISHAIHTSEYSLDLGEQISNLLSLFNGLDPKDDYSRSDLLLQISKLHILAGEYDKSREFLTQNFDVIYKHENKRQVANLNTIMAHLLYLKGQAYEALALCKVARANLDDKTDSSLVLAILGLELKILDFLNKDTSEQEKLLSVVSKKIDKYLNKRIQNRLEKSSLRFNYGQDPLGDLLDEIKNKPTEETLRKIISHGFLRFVAQYFDLKPGQKYIIVCHKINSLILADGEGIEVVNARISRTSLKILECLKSGKHTKEQLIQKVWNYSYDPLRHDSLIYTAMARLRKHIHSRGQWIVNENNDYYLLSDVKIIIYSPNKKKSNLEKFVATPKPPTEIALDEQDLNYRQLETLRSEWGPISVSEYAVRWEVTNMTALRDLRGLCQQGYFVIRGRGRATRYYRLSH